MTEQKSAAPSDAAFIARAPAKPAVAISTADVSALMDNELTRRECDAAVGALAEDESLRATWQRFHLMRTALRHEPHYPVATDLADRIAARLNAGAVPARRGLAGLRWPSPARRGTAYTAAYKGAAGLALAASVAAVAIVGVRTLTPGAAVPPQATLALAPSTVPATAVSPAPVGVAVAARTPRRGTHWDTAQPEVENNLNAFLVQHSEFTRPSGMGVMSYVRIAGYDTDYDPSKE